MLNITALLDQKDSYAAAQSARDDAFRELASWAYDDAARECDLARACIVDTLAALNGGQS